METRTTIENLVHDLDLPLDGVRDPEQLGTLVVLLDAAHSLLKHAEAIARTLNEVHRAAGTTPSDKGLKP